ncbi:hypothetical protein [Lysobacter brunescens]|uniref:Uncharacterized protein n=1 Tax=Lysobacter brunescens TaxID=262323 RepID=A0ABW2YC05_9GAMM
MADLQGLCDTLQSLADSGASAKVSYYYVGDDGVALRNGAILVDHGVRAHIDHGASDAAASIAAIATLKLVKVASLQMSEVRPAPHMASVDLAQLIAEFNAHIRRAAVPAPAPAPVPAPRPAEPAPGSTAQFVAILAAPSIELRSEALKLLEPLFGVGAARKVDDFARLHPPAERPQEFLLQCQQHVSVMLGASKAEALFRPLYDRLESERLHRRS